MLVPVIGDFVNVPAGGGGSATPQLPQWMFDAEGGTTPDAGCFTADSTSLATANNLYFSYNPFGTPESWAGGINSILSNHCLLIMVDDSGHNSACLVVSPSDTGMAIQIAIGGSYRSSALLSGKYSISFWPYQAYNLTEIYNNSGVSPVADATYTVGIGGTTNGTITTVKGVITAVQEAT